MTRTIYILDTGEKVLAQSALELVEHMRKGSFDDGEESLEQYMFRFSERCLLQQKIIRIDSPENFVADLHKTGMIKNIINTRPH